MGEVNCDVQRIASQRRGSEAEGQRMAEAWCQTGESRTAFARRDGIAVHRLAYRITRTAQAHRPMTPRGPMVFHPVHVVPDRVDAGSPAPIEIRVPSGVPPEEVRAVLPALDLHD